VIRRIHVRELHVGEVPLDTAEAHHLRDVLRLPIGTVVEAFDDEGHFASATIQSADEDGVVIRIDSISQYRPRATEITVAAAVPKGERADWMVEKLSELGVARFIPLATERSVVLPAGKNKIERWERIAVESAKQSRRPGLMTIDQLTALDDVIQATKCAWYLSTQASATAIRAELLESLKSLESITLFIGPEGGWTDEEIRRFDAAGFTAVALTATVLRVETAAIAAAAVIACHATSFKAPIY
jgi:16S rRNA (uracil1498-N3)-methyltransferase